MRQTVASVGKALERAVGQLEEGSGEISVFRTDQGSVYTSVAFNEIIREVGIVHSCSRAGKPTDNHVNESLNGWIKEELLADFHFADAKSFREAHKTVGNYVDWYNSESPCWSLGYMTSDAFYEAFMSGEIERRDTFRNRALDPTPKFVRERLAAAEEAAKANGGIGSSGPILFERRVHDVA